MCDVSSRLIFSNALRGAHHAVGGAASSHSPQNRHANLRFARKRCPTVISPAVIPKETQRLPTIHTPSQHTQADETRALQVPSRSFLCAARKVWITRGRISLRSSMGRAPSASRLSRRVLALGSLHDQEIVERHALLLRRNSPPLLSAPRHCRRPPTSAARSLHSPRPPAWRSDGAPRRSGAAARQKVSTATPRSGSPRQGALQNAFSTRHGARSTSRRESPPPQFERAAPRVCRVSKKRPPSRPSPRLLQRCLVRSPIQPPSNTNLPFLIVGAPTISRPDVRLPQSKHNRRRSCGTPYSPRSISECRRADNLECGGSPPLLRSQPHLPIDRLGAIPFPVMKREQLRTPNAHFAQISANRFRLPADKF